MYIYIYLIIYLFIYLFIICRWFLILGTHMVRLAKWDTARPNHPGAEAEAGRSDGKILNPRRLITAFPLRIAVNMGVDPFFRHTYVKSWGFPGKDMRQLSVAMCIEYQPEWDLMGPYGPGRHRRGLLRKRFCPLMWYSQTQPIQRWLVQPASLACWRLTIASWWTLMSPAAAEQGRLTFDRGPEENLMDHHHH